MITLTEVPFPKYEDYLYADKSLNDTNTIICQRTNLLGSLQKYESVKQSFLDGSIFTNYTTKTESGLLTGSFDLATGIWTCPSTGWYYIQSFFSWLINTGNTYSFTSNNANTSGQPFMSTATGMGTFSLSNAIDSNNTFGVNSKALSQSNSNIYLSNSQLVQVPSATQIQVVFTNNTDLTMYGQLFSSLQFKAIKLASY